MLAWMQYSWAEDYNEQWKLLENNSYLTASFSHPQEVKKALGSGGKAYKTTDQDFDKASESLRQMPVEVDPRILEKLKKLDQQEQLRTANQEQQLKEKAPLSSRRRRRKIISDGRSE